MKRCKPTTLSIHTVPVRSAARDTEHMQRALLRMEYREASVIACEHPACGRHTCWIGAKKRVRTNDNAAIIPNWPRAYYETPAQKVRRRKEEEVYRQHRRRDPMFFAPVASILMAGAAGGFR